MKLHPCCAHHCRTWAETANGRIPPSEHSPGCKEYRPERFALLDYDGAKCVVEWGERGAFSGDEGLTSISEIWMTRDQFQRLDEFDGP